MPLSSSKELHAAGLMVTWLAMLEEVQAALVLDATEHSLRRVRAASCQVTEARLYATGLSEARGSASKLLERSELSAALPPKASGGGGGALLPGGDLGRRTWPLFLGQKRVLIKGDLVEI